MNELRPYQVNDIAVLRDLFAGASLAEIEDIHGASHRVLLEASHPETPAILYCLPTGAGKTIIFVELARRAHGKGKRVLIVVHRRELLKQAVNKLAQAGMTCGVIASGFRPAPDQQIQVASVQTLVRRLHQLPEFDVIIFDEAHHCRAKQWEQVIESQPKALLLGVTATPARLDGKGLGRKAGGCFTALVIGPDTKELTAQGYLSPARCFVPGRRLDLSGIRTVAGDYDRSAIERLVNAKIIGDATVTYRQRAVHKPAIAYCISIKHAGNTAQAFQQAGFRAAAVSGETPTHERDALVGGLADGSIEVLASCDLISEGLDVPDLGCVILLRPTKSLVLHRQQVGRRLRPAPGKVLIVLDHVSNCLTHGLPDTGIAWSLDGIDKKLKPPPMWRCAACGCLNPMSEWECEACGADRPDKAPKPRTVTVAPGRLTELSSNEAHISRLRNTNYYTFLAQRRTETELREFAAARGYAPGWVWHRLREQEAEAQGSSTVGPFGLRR